MIPTNEQETIALFAQFANELGYEFRKMGTSCPDAILGQNGTEVRVEFEHRALNFKKHKHPIEAADLIICWQDDWPSSPLPVLSLEKYVTLAKPAPPIPGWKRWLRKLKEIRLTIIQHRAETKEAKLKLRRASYCKACGTKMRVTCVSDRFLNRAGQEYVDNYVTSHCPACGFEVVDRYAFPID